MNFLKKVLGNSPIQELVSIPSGQLFLARSQNSLKGYSECIYKDAAASIRRTATEYHYQLVVQRAYEEGEEQLEDEDEDVQDEWTYLIDESLHFRITYRDDQAVLAWRDLSGDSGDLLEFVCDASTSDSLLKTFGQIAVQCQYERKYKEPWTRASDEELLQFVFNDEETPVPPTTPPASPPRRSPASPAAEAEAPAPSTPKRGVSMAPPKTASERPTITGDVLGEFDAELHLYDAATGVFMLQDSLVKLTIVGAGSWKYKLYVDGSESYWLTLDVAPELNPVFNFEHTSFIFNYFSDDGGAYSWLLRFGAVDVFESFQQALMCALWESLNHMHWTKSQESEREFVIEAFTDMSIDEREREEDDEDEDDFEDAEENISRRSEVYDEAEDQDSYDGRFTGDGKNSQLAVGYKHDRSFVVRGNKIGVFKHTPSNQLEFATTIENVATPGGKSFAPKKVMLHAEDSSMILQNAADPHSLYRMDLEYGKVVDEWKVHDDVAVEAFTPSKKFSQMTGEQTFVGMSRDGLFRVDPRLSGKKLVDAEYKQYATKNDFSAVATTEAGYLAVASNKGDIRLYDRLGIRAKTQIPALGEPILAVDVSADGKWILATCKTYLLLIDASIKEGKFAGKLGFERGFGADSKPRPRRLQLSPEHVAQMQSETRTPLAFTQGHFNTGVNASETTIVSSSGPYIITWNLKHLLRGDKVPYVIKRYSDNITADNFKFGSDRNVIVALPDDVGMVNKKSFRKPTRESIATPVRQLRSRTSIVNSPF
ncbi:VID27 cytoplasmic protein-domain-containing protein [Dipodascopsis tothii]|uniref:VID27 cytoplasmic protein-domain-containing protein n=1 Tax=Dipodascopsis tothii TaxID=44089 RepID=UPI0034CFE68F